LVFFDVELEGRASGIAVRIRRDSAGAGANCRETVKREDGQQNRDEAQPRTGGRKIGSEIWVHSCQSIAVALDSGLTRYGLLAAASSHPAIQNSLPSIGDRADVAEPKAEYLNFAIFVKKKTIVVSAAKAIPTGVRRLITFPKRDRIVK